MGLTKLQCELLIAVAGVLICTVWSQNNVTFETHPDFQFEPLKRSDMLRAKAMLRWLIDNRTENGTRTFNAGFIRLIFHDCVGGCDGCLNLLNPGNTGLGFYKLPLDLMYRDFIFPIMSRADWYALAGVVAVEYASELTPCKDVICKPHLTFLWGRRDCANERQLFRFIPGPTLDPRFTIRNVFRLNFVEITALMGAHCLGKNHQKGKTWVRSGTKFNNQYYKDLLDTKFKWKRGNGSDASNWVDKDEKHLMLSSDMFMAFDVSSPTCQENPTRQCNVTNTFELVRMFSESNAFWLREFGVAFNVMMNNGHFGRLRQVVLDTIDEEFTGELFPEGSNRTAAALEKNRTKSDSGDNSLVDLTEESSTPSQEKTGASATAEKKGGATTPKTKTGNETVEEPAATATTAETKTTTTATLETSQKATTTATLETSQKATTTKTQTTTPTTTATTDAPNGGNSADPRVNFGPSSEDIAVAKKSLGNNFRKQVLTIFRKQQRNQNS